MLTVTPSGTGSGTVTGTGIDCGADCTESYAQDTAVTLTAVPEGSSTFAGWSGDCSGSDATCELTMDSAKSVTATFDQASGTTGKELSGTLENWIGQAAILKAELANTEDSAVLAEAPIGADGSFSLTLPGSEGVAEYLGPVQGTSCEEGGGTGTIEVTPSTLKVAEVDYKAYDSTDSNAAMLGEVFHAVRSEGSSTLVIQLYAASSGTIKGSCTYTFEDENGVEATYTHTYDVNLVAGWNDFMFTFTQDGATSSTGKVPTTASWEYVEGP